MFAPLTLSNVVKINSAWPHRYDGSDQFVAYSIKFHLSLGLFDGNGELLAWSLMYDNGSLGVVQVDENHLRKGYGSLIVKGISRKIVAEYELDVTALVVQSNERSLQFFTKLGFKQTGEHTWFGMKNK